MVGQGLAEQGGEVSGAEAVGEAVSEVGEAVGGEEDYGELCDSEVDWACRLALCGRHEIGVWRWCGRWVGVVSQQQQQRYSNQIADTPPQFRKLKTRVGHTYRKTTYYAPN